MRAPAPPPRPAFGPTLGPALTLALRLGLALAIAALGASPAAAAPAPGAALLTATQVGQREDALLRALAALGATVEVYAHDRPGAYAEGMMRGPGLLSQLRLAGAAPPAFQGLQKRGPRFVRASLPGADAAYLLVNGQVWAAGLRLSAAQVAPHADPFRADRLAPLTESLDALCPRRAPSAADPWGNATAWTATDCRGGRAALRHQPGDPLASVLAVVYPR